MNKVKRYEVEFVMSRRKKLSKGFIRVKFWFNIGRVSVGPNVYGTVGRGDGGLHLKHAVQRDISSPKFF
jgi:hypothetical protein